MKLAWRRLRDDETDHEVLWTSVAAALSLLFVLWMRLVEWPPLLCPFRVVTGLPCPTCGSTRALLALAAGDVSAAWRWNPLLVGILALSAIYLAYATVVAVCGLPRLRVQASARAGKWLRAGALFVVTAGWIFLIVDGR